MHQGKVSHPGGPAGVTIDPYQDAISCTTLPFDTWCMRHDTFKLALVERAQDSRVVSVIELYIFFLDLLHVTETDTGEDLEYINQRQGLFMIS